MRFAALGRPDVLVVEVHGAKGLQLPLRAAQASSNSGRGVVVPLAAGQMLAINGSGWRRRGSRLDCDSEVARFVFALDVEAGRAARRAGDFVPALETAIDDVAQSDAAWLAQGSLLRTPVARIDRAFVRALQQLRACIAHDGRVVEVDDGAFVRVPLGREIEAASALWLVGRARLARKVVEAALIERDASARVLVRARASVWAALGLLPARPYTNESSSSGSPSGAGEASEEESFRGVARPFEHGDERRIVSLCDRLHVAAHAARLEELTLTGEKRLPWLLTPRDARSTAELLLVGSLVPWAHGGSSLPERSRPWIIAQLAIRAPRVPPKRVETPSKTQQGWLGWRGRGKGGAKAASAPSTLATCHWAEARLARGDRDAALAKLLLVAEACDSPMGFRWSPRASGRRRTSSAAAAAFVLASLGLVARPRVSAGQAAPHQVELGLPAAWGAARILRVPWLERRDLVVGRSRQGDLEVRGIGDRIALLRNRDGQAATRDPTSPALARLPAAFVARGDAAPLPDQILRSARGSARYQRLFDEFETALVALWRGKRPRIVGTRAALGDERKARARLRRWLRMLEDRYVSR